MYNTCMLCVLSVVECQAVSWMCWFVAATQWTCGTTVWWIPISVWYHWCTFSVSSSVKSKFHYADFPATSTTNPWRSRWFVHFPVSCRIRRQFSCFPDANVLVADFHRNFSNHLDVSQWFETPWLPRNMIHVGNFPVTSRSLPQNFPDTCRGEV